MESKLIPIISLLPRIALLICCIVLSSAFIVFAKWCFGNSISTQVSEVVLAEFAVRLAPSDPQSHYSLAVVNEKTFVQENIERSLSAYQRALSLSPRDFRLWLAAAKALERSGEVVIADQAFKRSLELAPNYAQVSWAYGNYLLRQGHNEAAFAEIRKAAESSSTYLQPAVSAGWQFLDGDVAKIRQFLGASPEMSSTLAAFLGGEKHFDEAFEIWNTLSDQDKKTRFRETGNQIFLQMVAGKRHRLAIAVYNGLIADQDARFAAEQFANGSFERDVKPEGANVFEWQLGAGIQPQFLFDDQQKSDAKRSLVLIFNSSDGRDFRGVSQTLLIQPGKMYEMSIAYRSELQTSATFRWEVVDTEGRVLAETAAVEAQSEWKTLDLRFTAPETEEAVTIRLARVKCGQGICPVSGKIWFDDFRLKF